MAFPPAQQLPSGPLSFIYNLVYDTDVSTAFSQNPTAVMNYFQLSPDVQETIKKAGDAGKPDDVLIMQFLAYLLPILNDPNTYFGKW
jgi:hypothetical protein